MNPYTYVLTTNGILFLLSIVFWKFPPKKINSIYGYRTHKTMQNQQIWDFANKVFNKHFLLYAAISFLASLLLVYIAKKPLTWQPMLLVALTLLVSIIKTERALKENFTDEGKKK